MNIVSRAEWGAAPAKSRTALVPSKVSRLVLHHTTGTFAGPQTVRNIQSFHQGPQRGWADIGYNFLIGDGVIFEGRGWGVSGAHARGFNATSIGVAFIGDGRVVPPVANLRAVMWLAGEADRRFGRLVRAGHRDVGSTACPGDGLYGWWVAGGALPEVPSAASEPVQVVPVPPVGEVSAGATTERPDPDGWANRPSWVRKSDWQRLIDWRNKQN